MKSIYKHIDYTLLKPTATKEDILNLCDEALEKNCASVCIPSSYVKLACENFPEVTVCTVVGFPLGNCSTAAKCAEAKKAVEDGAKEIDMVINISAVENGDYDYIADEINVIKTVIGKDIILKVIIETCYLDEIEIQLLTGIIALCTDADYIKTSTGFGTRGASFHDIEIIKANIFNGKKIKASGGIRTLEDMEKYLEMGCDRIGASCLP